MEKKTQAHSCAHSRYQLCEELGFMGRSVLHTTHNTFLCLDWRNTASIIQLNTKNVLVPDSNIVTLAWAGPEESKQHVSVNFMSLEIYLLNDPYFFCTLYLLPYVPHFLPLLSLVSLSWPDPAFFSLCCTYLPPFPVLPALLRSAFPSLKTWPDQGTLT